MDIGIYSHYFVPEIGAPSARLYDLSREWIRAGHAVDVVTCFPNHPTGRVHPGYRVQRYMHETLDDIEVHRLWTYVTPNRGIIKRTLGHVSFLLSSLFLSQEALGPLDVIIGSSPTLFAAIAAERRATRMRKPFVMEVRDLWPALFADLGILRNKTVLRALEKLELWLYRRARGVVTVTEAFRQNLIERGVPAEKVVTIPNGADVDYWQPSLADPHRDDAKFTVLYIGAHGISQGLSAVIDAAALLRDLPDVRVVFVGEGADKPAVVARAREAGLQNVHFHDAVDKAGVRDWYAAADVCLVPLRDIPLFSTFIPSKMFEILAMERPIIASVRGEAADILARSRAAVIVPPEDSAAIASAIRDMRARTDRAAMGVRGRRFVIDHYSREALARRYAGFLESLRR